MPPRPRLKSGDEVEIKLVIRDVAAIRTKLTAAGAKFRRRVHEHNTLFDTAGSALRLSGQVVRIRIETPDHKGYQVRARRGYYAKANSTPGHNPSNDAPAPTGASTPSGTR